MGRLAALLLIGGALLVIQAPPAAADCRDVAVTTIVQGVVRVTMTVVCSDSVPTSTANQTGPTPPTDSGLDPVCVNESLSQGIDPVAFCTPPPTDETPEITAELVAAAFAQMPLPARDLVVQPPGGRTLVNFDTNFYTEAAPFETTITLLGQPVALRVRATGFTWHYGDGQTATTTTPGAAYPALDVTHRYLRKGTVRASVDITYAADYSVAGGPWAPVPGTAIIAGPAQPLDVVTARPVLVAGAG